MIFWQKNNFRTQAYPLTLIILLLTACSTVKLATAPAIEKEKATEPHPVIYQAAYTRLTDIINTKLDISFNWDSAFVYGKACIEAKPYFYPANQIILNANGFKINEVALVVKTEKQPLKYSYDGKFLKIQLDKEYTRDQEYTVFIDYVAMPNKLVVGKDISIATDRGLYFINPDGKEKDKPKQVWSQGETECNSSWFPTIENSQEKMTQDVSITVPNNMVTLSNGLLDFTLQNADGTHTDTWRQEKPHSTYLTMIAAGEFVVTKDKWRDKEVNYYMEPVFAPMAKKVFGNTPEMMEFFSKKLRIDFPWDKYSQIVVRDFIAGAMENTSATVLFDRMNMTEGQYLDNTYEDVISHELFHQWFGDLVTPESWANLPLSESFATYGEYLWNEYKYGTEYADFYGMSDLHVYLKNEQAKKESVIRFGYDDREKMFDDVSYQKGGRILHMLRKTVGDEAFFKALNLYLTQNSYKSAEISNLRMAFEEITGQDLNWFFNQWFMESGNPVLNIQSGYDAVTGKVSVNIKQIQDLTKMPLYRIPMAIDIYAEGKVRRERIVLDKQDQTFQFTASAEPQLVNVDAEKYILGEKNEKKSVQQNIFQYENAPLFMDRYEAITALQSVKNDRSAHGEMIKALNDKHWEIRRMALQFLPELTQEERQSVYMQIRNMAVKDERSYVRAEAITQLAKSYGQLNNKEIFTQAAKDKAPSVIRVLDGK